MIGGVRRGWSPGPGQTAIFLTLLILLMLSLLLSACYRGAAAPPTPFDELPPPPNLTPQPVVIDGSALMQPLMAGLGTAFQRFAPQVSVVVGASGTRTGFGRFCAGEVALHDALRPINESEEALCGANGIGWQAITVAYDAAAVVVSAENAFAGCLNLVQLRSIWEADSVVQNWQQVHLQYVDLPLVAYAPPADSLAYTLFQERVLEGRAMHWPLNEGPPVGPEAIGFLPLGQALQLGPAVRLLPLAASGGELVAAGGDCILPEEQTVLDGRYPLARPLLLYVNAMGLAQPEIRQFLRFVLSAEADPVIRGWYLVPPTAESRVQAVEQLGLLKPD